MKSNNFDYATVAVGEPPYTETAGDSTTLTMMEPGPSIINNVCGTVKCVVVIISGRPIVIEPYVSAIDALVAAWLPGTEGQGVTDVLYGDYGFSGKLPSTWFKTVDQLPMNVGDSHYDPLFPFDFGLKTDSIASIVSRYSLFKFLLSNFFFMALLVWDKNFSNFPFDRNFFNIQSLYEFLFFF